MATATLHQTEREELISGSEAIAIACSLADVDVITAYPIRPYDTVMQYVSKLKADGAFDCDFIVAESEHSQFEIVKHASAVGGPHLLRLQRCGLVLRLRGDNRDGRPAPSRGRHGGQPRPGRPRSLRR